MGEGKIESVTDQMTIGELRELKELEPVRDYLFTHMTEEVLERPLSFYRPEICRIRAGLMRVRDLLAAGHRLIYDVYTEEEIRQAPDREEVKLLFFPGIGSEEKRPYVLFCPGGGYFRQWVMPEGYPTALEYNQLGYPVFLLLYRAGQKGLLPKPMEDVAAAIRLIEEKETEFHVDAEHYIIGGFSAGGHLAASWGTKKLGYQYYSRRKPEEVVLIYPGSSMDCFYVPGLEPEKQPGFEYLERALGDQITPENIRHYSIEYQIDGDYPPVYLLHNRDDSTVPVETSFRLKESLEKWPVPCRCRFPDSGEHACGVAHGLAGEGWVGESIDFWLTCQSYQTPQRKR